MTLNELTALLPMLALAGGAVVVLAALAIRRSYNVTCLLAGLSLVAALVLIRPAWSAGLGQVSALLYIDSYALFYIGLLIASALVVLGLAVRYLRHVPQAEEFYVLLILSTLGACVLVASDNLVSFFIGLELLSIPLYVLLAYVKTREESMEAGLKYLILAGSSSALLLAGMALIYAQCGSLAWSVILTATHAGWPWMSAGLGLILTALAFKLALPPLHMWIADVYQGSVLPATAYIATVSKAAIVVLMVRYLTPMLDEYGVRVALTVLAILAMTVGNLLALRQENLKRLLAYSSIAHMGYLMVAVLAGTVSAQIAVGFYLVVYIVAMLTAFGVLMILGGPADETQDIRGIEGLAIARPMLAGVMIVAMLSLAGIPITGGFFGKFYIVLAGAQAKAWPLLIVLIANSVVGLFYYLRVIAAMLSAHQPAIQSHRTTHQASTAILGLLTILLICLGAFPGVLSEFLAIVLR
jgi:NADH-quinone oxidoreductase subunit N